MKQMKPVGGAFDHISAAERSPFAQRAQRVMTSGTDISIKNPEAASEFVNLVKEAGSRQKGPLLHILQASVNKEDKQVTKDSRCIAPAALCSVLYLHCSINECCWVQAWLARKHRLPSGLTSMARSERCPALGYIADRS